jgi:fibronectin-binding autotransporter adhesin
MMSFPCRQVFVAALLLVAAPAAPAQLTTWTGTAGDGNWFNAANWSNGVPGTGTPTANSSAFFQATAPTTVNLQATSSSVLDRITFGTAPSAYTFNNGTLVLVNGAFVRISDTTDTATQTFNAAVQFNGSGTLRNDSTAGAILNLANVSTTAGAELVANATGAINISGVVSGGTLTKTGTGTLTLSGVNTYTGPTVISGGVLSVSSLANGGLNSGIGMSSNAAENLVLDGGTLRYTGASGSTDRLFTLGSGGGTLDSSGAGGISFTNPGAVTYTGSGARTLTLTGSGNTGFLEADIGDAGGASVGLTKSGTNPWMLFGTNTYSGPTAVLSGSLSLRGGAAASPNSAYTISGGASLFIPELATYSIGSLSGAGTVTGKTTAGVGAATLSAGGNNTSTTFSGVLQNANTAEGRLLALTKAGTGTLILSGTNTYTGATTVSAGTLRVTGSLAAGSAVAVNSGGTLGGTGTVGGAVAVNSGGTIAPGNSIGTLRVGGTTWAGGGGYAFEYNAAATTPIPGTDNDLLKGGGTATLSLAGLSSGNRFKLAVTATGSGAGSPVTYRFAEYDTITGASAGDVSGLFDVTGDFRGTPIVTLTLDGAGLDFLAVTFQPVPEPAAGLGLAAAGLGLARAARRKRLAA